MARRKLSEMKGALKSKKLWYAVAISVIVTILGELGVSDTTISIIKYAGTLLIAGHTITDIVALILKK